MAMQRAAGGGDRPPGLQPDEPAGDPPDRCTEERHEDQRWEIEVVMRGRNRRSNQRGLARPGQTGPAHDRRDEHAQIVKRRAVRVEVQVDV